MKRLLASALAIGFAAAAAAQSNPQGTSAAALPPVQPPPLGRACPAYGPSPEHHRPFAGGPGTRQVVRREKGGPP